MKTVYFWPYNNPNELFIIRVPSFVDVYYRLRFCADSYNTDICYHVFNDDFSYEIVRKGTIKCC